MNNKSFIEYIKKAEYAGFNAIEYADRGLELYLSFETLLEWTNMNLNMFSAGVEIIKIDFESDKPMFMYSTTISTNLQKCYVRNSYLGTTEGTLKQTATNTVPAPFKDIDYFKTEELRQLNTTLNTPLKTEAGSYEITSEEGAIRRIYPTIGNISNIYLNAIYIDEQLKKYSDNESNTVSIAKFLQEICNGVNKALGSINDLQVVGDVDGEQPMLTIVDFQQVRIRGLVNKATTEKRKTSTINAQGLKSMVTSISAQSSITPELATTISIGAQANGEALGQEAVAFQKLNTGLEDRIYPTKGITSKLVEKQQVLKLEREKEAADKFKANLQSYAGLINNQRPVPGDIFGPVSLRSDEKTSLENIPVELYKYMLGQFTQTNQTAAGFIPIKLDLTLYGISGIKIFQKFKITKDVLPFSYGQDYEFTITGVSHAVDSARWSTSISSIMGLAEKDLIDGEAFNVELNLEDRDYTSTSSPQSGNPTPPGDVFDGSRFPRYWSTKTQKANSAVLKKAKQSENGKLPASDLFTFKWKDPKTGRVVTKQTLKVMEAPLKELFDKAYEDGIDLTINSAYRSYADQERVWRSNCVNEPGTGSCQARPGFQQAARVGTSNHGVGVAFDLGNRNGSRIMPNYVAGRTDTRPEYKWMAINGPKYGFYRLSWLVAQKGNSAYNKNENWESHHWEYLG